MALAMALPACAQQLIAMSDPGGAPDLDQFLALQRLVYPGAAVSATFYEWRSTSKYRSTAGLHLGYDIAMPAGTPAVAGWPGQVTRVAQWFGSEYGITVLSPSGYETTYGHLSPKLKVGDVVNAGDTVGIVVNDHVDLKMRGPDGMFFDFGHSTPPAVGTFPMPVPIRPTRADAMRMYQAAWYGGQLDEEELKMAKSRQQSAAAELEATRTRVRKSRADLPKMKQFLADGLVARADVARAASDVNGGVSQVNALQAQLRAAQADVASREARVRTNQAQLAAAASVLSSMGVSKGEMEKSLRKPATPAVVSQARELQLMRKRHGTTASSASNPALLAARNEAERMKELYGQGVVSRAERDRAQARYDAMLKGH